MSNHFSGSQTPHKPSLISAIQQHYATKIKYFPFLNRFTTIYFLPISAIIKPKTTIFHLFCAIKSEQVCAHVFNFFENSTSCPVDRKWNISCTLAKYESVSKLKTRRLCWPKEPRDRGRQSQMNQQVAFAKNPLEPAQRWVLKAKRQSER